MLENILLIISKITGRISEKSSNYYSYLHRTRRFQERVGTSYSKDLDQQLKKVVTNPNNRAEKYIGNLGGASLIYLKKYDIIAAYKCGKIATYLTREMVSSKKDKIQCLNNKWKEVL